MYTILLLLLLWAITITTLQGAQLNHTPPSKNLCSVPGGYYCIRDSLQGPEIISCLSRSNAELRSCNIELARILPKGHETKALCYESSPTAGDAICAFNGTGYTRRRLTVPLPETVIREHELDGVDREESLAFASLLEGLSVSPSPRLRLRSSSRMLITSSAVQGTAALSHSPTVTPVVSEPRQTVQSRIVCFDRGVLDAGAVQMAFFPMFPSRGGPSDNGVMPSSVCSTGALGGSFQVTRIPAGTDGARLNGTSMVGSPVLTRAVGGAATSWMTGDCRGYVLFVASVVVWWAFLV